MEREECKEINNVFYLQWWVGMVSCALLQVPAFAGSESKSTVDSFLLVLHINNDIIIGTITGIITCHYQTGDY